MLFIKAKESSLNLEGVGNVFSAAGGSIGLLGPGGPNRPDADEYDLGPGAGIRPDREEFARGGGGSMPLEP